MKRTRLKLLSADQIVTLKRNPQYLTPKQMESLKRSIRRDGFCVPILVRPISGNRYEVVSGNHRFMASQELNMKMVPAVVATMSDNAVKRLAINLNTIHGEPNVELLAPFLAECDAATLSEIHVEEEMRKQLLDFDAQLADRLSKMSLPDGLNRKSPKHSNATCKCKTCGAIHFKKK